MNKIELVISDMDGTLLDSSKTISRQNIEAVNRLYKKGIRFAIATGRNYKEVKNYTSHFDYPVPIISLNGGRVHDEKGAVISKRLFEKEQLKEIINYLTQEKIYFELSDDEFVYSNNRASRIKLISKLIKPLNRKEVIENTRYKMTKFCQYNEIIDNVKEIYKIRVLKLNNENLEEIKQTIKENHSCEVSSSGPSNIEINPKGVTKGAGILKLANHYEIDLVNSVGIGDHLNDLPMMEVVGISCGMQNGHKELRENCDFITNSNDTNGVAAVLNKLTKN